MPIEWVGESLSSTYTHGDTRPVDALAKGPPNREEETQGNTRQNNRKNPYRESLQQRPQRLERAVFAREIMQTRVLTAFPNEPISKALDLVLTHHILHIPVIHKGNKLAGMISHLHLLEATAGQQVPIDTELSHIMKTRILTATGNTTLHELSRVMVMEDLEAVPILDNAQKLVGLVTTSEMMQCIVHHSKLNIWI